MDTIWWHISTVFSSRKKQFVVWEKSELKKLLAQNDKLKAESNLVKCGLNCFMVNTDDNEDNAGDTGEAIEVTRDGAVPQSEPMFPHEDESKWYLPKCDRNNAERLLKGRRDGTFLVRNSSQLEKYVLSIVLRGHIKHIVIQEMDDGFCLHGSESHPTLYSLILSYAQPVDHKCDHNCANSCKTLHFPVFQ